VQPSWTSKERRPLTIINMDLLRFFVLGKKATVIIISLESSSHQITHHHPIFWISQENLTGITMCKYACHISKLNWIVVNPFSLCRHFGNNREDAAYKNIERTPSLLQVVNVEHHHPFFSCQRGSSSSCIAVVFMFFVSLPVGCHAFVPPC
jgi:hypothetical protein